MNLSSDNGAPNKMADLRAISVSYISKHISPENPVAAILLGCQYLRPPVLPSVAPLTVFGERAFPLVSSHHRKLEGNEKRLHM